MVRRNSSTALAPVGQSSPAARPTYRVPAVSRAFDILSLLQRAPQGLGVSEIARTLDIGKGPCFAILKTLEAIEAVVCEETRKVYRLGAALVKIGNAVLTQNQYVEIARSEMEHLGAQIGLACFLSGPYGSDEYIVLAKTESTEKIKVTLDVGEHFHALGGAHGKALLAWQPTERVEEIVRRLGLPRYTARSITDLSAFRRELERTRRNGYAESYGEYMIGVNSVAAAILTASGDVVLILKTLGSSDQLSQARMREFGKLVRASAEAVTVRLGGRYPSRKELG